MICNLDVKFDRKDSSSVAHNQQINYFAKAFIEKALLCFDHWLIYRNAGQIHFVQGKDDEAVSLFATLLCEVINHRTTELIMKNKIDTSWRNVSLCNDFFLLCRSFRKDFPSSLAMRYNRYCTVSRRNIFSHA